MLKGITLPGSLGLVAAAYWVARDLFQHIAEAYEHAAAYGPEHSDTLAARHALATYTGQAGDPARARDLLAELLPVHERVLGVEHPPTLSTQHQLASYTGEAGGRGRSGSRFTAGNRAWWVM